MRFSGSIAWNCWSVNIADHDLYLKEGKITKRTLIHAAAIGLTGCFLFTGCGMQEAEASGMTSSEGETQNIMQNIEPGAVPLEYYDSADEKGTVENFMYDTRDYIGNGEAIQSRASIYLPYGYDENDTVTRYNILYLQHGAYGNEWYHDTTPVFYSGEIRNDLMPAVETYYHTYADDISDAGFTVSSGYGKEDYAVFAAIGTCDVAYQGLSAQIEAMKDLTEAVDYTDSGFADGNMMYYTVEGNQHDYPYTYEYVYNGLRMFAGYLK